MDLALSLPPSAILLPHKWASVRLSSLLATLESGSRPRGGVNGISSGVPSIGGEHLRADGGFNFTNIRYVPLDFAAKMNRGQIVVGDVLVVKDGATTGKVSFVRNGFPETAVVNEHVFIARPSPQTLSAYVFYYLYSQTGRDAIMLDFRGAAQGGISQSFADKVIVPLAPFPEQHRIVAEIERQFSLLDAGIANLKRVQANLKRYRAAVLQAACEGRLAAKADVNEGKALDILPELALLEDNTLKVTESKKRAGRLWGSGVVPDLSAGEQASIPDHWTWSTVRQIGHDADNVVQVGPMSMRSQDFRDEGIPVLNVGCVQWDRFNEDKLNFMPEEPAKQFDRYRLLPGDVMFTRSGTVGRCAVIQEHQRNWLMTFHLLRVRPDEKKCLPKYLRTVFEGAAHIRRQTREASIGTTRAGFNTTLLQNLAVPLPPLAEQERIMAEVERRLSVVDNLEQVVKANLKRAERLRQAVLKEAFAGRLVPQDPNDEPASVLLERIKAEREATQKEKKTPTARAKAGTGNGIQRRENGDIGAVSFEKDGQGAIAL